MNTIVAFGSFSRSYLSAAVLVVDASESPRSVARTSKRYDIADPHEQGGGATDRRGDGSSRVGRASAPSAVPVAFMIPRPVAGAMTDILAENLSGKAVMGSDGTELGMLYNITMDVKSGALGHLLVSPDEAVQVDTMPFEVDESGRFRVPVANVQAVKDYIVVGR
jgi:sporulation protein YlmC with PRC-barrel domain